MKAGEPIFVHAWWRSGSTYVWSRLRRDPQLVCYYEPLNERLAELGAADLERNERGASKALRHPEVEDHYFAEYAALLRAGTLRYSRDLAYSRYLLTPSQPDPALESYLRGLVEDARSRARRAALCFCRSQMRSAWMKSRLGGLHVAQLRNPASQFASFGVARYFPARMLAIARHLCVQHPQAFEHIPQLHAQVASGTRPLSVPQGELRALFALLWTASALQALDAADCVIDVDRVSVDAQARQDVGDWFRAAGCSIALDDCAVPGAAEAARLPPQMAQAMETAAGALRTHAKALAPFEPARVSKWLGALSPASRAVVENAAR